MLWHSVLICLPLADHDPKQASCNFSPGDITNLYNVPEQKCVLPTSFSGLTNATFTVSNSQIANQVTVLYTDDYVYTTSSICCR